MKVWIFVAAALAAAPLNSIACAQEAPARAAAAAAKSAAAKSAGDKMQQIDNERRRSFDAPVVQRMSWGTSVIKPGVDDTKTGSIGAQAKAAEPETKAPAKKAAPKKKSATAAKATKKPESPAVAAVNAAADKGEALAAGHRYGKIVARYAMAYGVSAELADAVIRVESNYRPNARGSHGEIGLMQIKPSTARMLGYSGSAKGLFDPETNIKYGMKYLAMANDLGDGSTCGTILKYNAGHAATRMNPVSKHYCGLVLAYMG